MRARTSRIVALGCATLVCSTLCGCGQTGMLYLPPDEGEVVSKGPGTATPAADPADEAEAARKRAQPATQNPAPQ